MSERRFPQPRWAVQERVLDRVLPPPRCVDGNLQLLDDAFLPDVLLKFLWPQRVVERILLFAGGLCGHHALARHGERFSDR